jgi:DNA-binding FadR family transcriptional regulator
MKRERPFIELDVEFHFVLAACSHNKVLPRLLKDIRGLLLEWISKSQELAGLRENAQIQHEHILQCVIDRNPEAARHAMRAHLQTFSRAYTLLGRISDSQELLPGRSIPHGGSLEEPLV